MSNLQEGNEKMLLSVMIPALESRPWQKIVNELKRQASYIDGVEILVEIDNGESTSGIKRNRLLHRSTGTYVCSVDDDDWIEPDYLHKIVEGCRMSPDVVTFWLDMTYKKYEKWQFGLWDSSREKSRMMVNHLCAWRRDHAVRVAYCNEVGYADDQLWFLPLYHAGYARTEFHVDKILYHYLFDRNVTANQKEERRQFTKQYVGEQGIKCYNDQGSIYIEVGGKHRYSTATGTLVRDNTNREFFLPTDKRQSYYTVRIN